MKKLFVLFAFTFLLFSCNQEPVFKYPTAIAVINNPSHIPTEIYSYTIDGCEYIGTITHAYQDILTHKGNCKNPIHNSIHLSSYQFQITDPDHASLYDDDKLIGSFKFTNTELDSLIRKDNL